MDHNQILLSLMSSIPVGTVFFFLVKFILKTYDEKHSVSKRKIETILTEINAIKVRLAEIQGEIHQAINVKDEFKQMQRDVWNHESQLKAAFKIIDHKRPSDDV